MLKATDLSVGNYMSAFPISVLAGVPISEVVSFMARRGIGNIVVSNEEGDPLGVLTEREIISLLAFHKALPDIQVNQIKLQKFEKLTPHTSVYEAAKTMFLKKSRLLVFSNDKVVGIVTATDLLRAFRRCDYSPSISQVVSKKTYQCSYDDKILDAVEIMHKKRIGSVLIERPEENWGIFTERDLIFKVLNNRVNLKEKLKLYSSFPLMTANYDILANEAASIMAANGIKRLVLTKNDDIMGVITARDLVDAYCHHVGDLLSAE
jgi:CBS domain-containing protein